MFCFIFYFLFVVTLYTEEDPSLLSPGAVFLVLVGIFLVQLLSNGRVGGISSLLAKLAEVLDGLFFWIRFRSKPKLLRRNQRKRTLRASLVNGNLKPISK